jgi:hypothetical protein
MRDLNVERKSNDKRPAALRTRIARYSVHAGRAGVGPEHSAVTTAPDLPQKSASSLPGTPDHFKASPQHNPPSRLISSWQKRLVHPTWESEVLRQYRHRTVLGSNPCSGKRFISTPSRPKQLWGPPYLPFDGCRGSLPRSNRPGRAVIHSPPTCAEVNSDWRYTSAVYTHLRGVHSGYFAFRYFSSFVPYRSGFWTTARILQALPIILSSLVIV